MEDLGGFGIAGKVAIVTGGGAAGDGIGNGRAAAILMAREGAKILVVDRDVPLAERTVEMIHAEGGEAAAFAADVTQSSACEALVKAALERWGRVDILDNNVGIGSRGSVVEETEAQWNRVMQVNVSTMFLVGKHAIPAMIETAGGGSVINVSSISALRPRGLTAYSASKGAVIALSRAMAIDHASDGIRVNCVAPGPVYTPMVYERGMSAQARANRAQASPLGIEGTGWDIGNAVLFLASERARYITGQTLVVDGGATIVGPKRESDDIDWDKTKHELP
jgi:NAD(P)-dependent dehydrogenase (short-subunit alcohol dehydrogenase family)